MTENDKPVLIYSTFPRDHSASVVGRQLVESRLAACVNIIEQMTAIYRWEGAVHEDDETVMVIKTRRALIDAVIAAVKERHPYANPALLVVPVEGGATAFIEWIQEETRTVR